MYTFWYGFLRNHQPAGTKLLELIFINLTLLQVTDMKQHVLFTKEDASSGKFAFTTEDYDRFEVCFISQGPESGPSREVKLVLKHGVEAKNYEETGKVEKLKPLEIELRRLEDLSESIVNDFSYMKEREEYMRDTNGEYKGIF